MQHCRLQLQATTKVGFRQSATDQLGPGRPSLKVEVEHVVQPGRAVIATEDVHEIAMPALCRGPS